MPCDIYGMCNPLYDIQAEIPEAILASTGFEKGSMSLIDEATQQALVSKIYDHIVNAESGGSGANTMIVASLLGASTCYSGKVASDEHGKLYAESLSKRGVKLCSAPGIGTTGICVVLITPDAERTMCTHLGICREFGPGDIDLEELCGAAFLYVTGYLWDTDTQKSAVLHAMQAAKGAGVKVAMSLSDPFCVARHHAAFTDIAEKYVDLLIGNADEMKMLAGCESVEEAILSTTQYCDMAALTNGAAGSLLRSGSKVANIAARGVTPVDTTGAGDTFAAGLLYGLTHSMSLEESGSLASILAARCVAKLGPRLDTQDIDDILPVRSPK